MNQISVHPKQLKSKDVFFRVEDGKAKTVWIALEDAVVHADRHVSCRVQFQPDGGIGTRTWDNDPDIEFEIFRG